MDYKKEVEKIVDQINNGVDLKYCRCSYMSLINMVQAALNGEIGEEFRLVRKKDPEVIERLLHLFNLK